ncbi:uncharacterized protein LOC129607008 [Condylostylus longicornis]|uniref:uncharacterized protein LOC129607008 n=1 Tax=Condylostylus longicornis TaxID=2530218 RepID=UPI00244E487B|nr:uncharacterized protein LOC129607008 [Condylostylus longicornis]XP_055373670.1 uncharacterized protein LOC129607008 [Condylostylus longicornis]
MSQQRFPSLYFQITALLILFVILLLLPFESASYGLKKPNQEPKPKKTFPFHKVTYVPIKEDDDVDEDIKEFFEKVHYADVKTSHSQLQIDNDEEDEDFEEDKRRLSFGLFGWFFGSKKNESDELEITRANNDDEELNYEKSENEDNKVLNKNNEKTGIITWLEYLMKTNEPSKSQSDNSKDIISEYFNRWPFNVIFPIGQSQKLVVPRNGGKWVSSQGISDEEFEILLEALPSFIINPNFIDDIDCKQQIQIFQRQLRGHKMWPLQMIDASGKISSGILRGNVNQFGDFDLCTNIKTSVKITNEVSVRIKGKYCLAHIEIEPTSADLKLAVHLLQGRGLWNSHLSDPIHFAPRYSIVNWGICIPHACQAQVVQNMIDRSLQPYNRTGIYFHVEVSENDCYIRNSTNFGTLLKHYKNIDFTFGYFLIFIFAAIASVLIENRCIFKNLFKMIQSNFKPKWLQMLVEFKKFVEIVKKSHREAQAEIEMQMNNSKMQTRDDVNATEVVGVLKEEYEKPEKKNETEKEEEIQVENVSENLEIEEENFGSETNFANDPVERTKSIFNDAILSFAPKRSIEALLSTEGQDTIFPIINVIKIFSTFMLYICFKYLMLGHLPVLNRDKLIMSFDTPLSIFYRSPILYFDILLMISGFIKAYHMCTEMEEKLHIHALKRLMLNILRFLPSLYAILLFQTWILPHLESGPLWNNIIRIQSQLCEKNLWRNIFGVQNAIDFEETCSPMTIQTSVEMQLYLLAPLIVWFFYCNSEVGFFLFGGINMISVALRYSRTYRDHLSPIIFHGMHISKFYRTANLLFSSPLSRATPFLIGIGAAILHKRLKKTFEDLSQIGLICGWFTAIASLIYCYWYPYSAIRLDYIYNSTDAASYASWSPLVLGLIMTWIIYIISCYTCNESRIHRYKILKSKPILILSRIIYPTQLIMYVTVLYFTAQQKEPRPYSATDLISFSEIGIIILYAIVVAIFVDIPMQKVSKLLVNEIFPDKSPYPSSNKETKANETEINIQVKQKLVNDESSNNEHESESVETELNDKQKREQINEESNYNEYEVKTAGMELNNQQKDERIHERSNYHVELEAEGDSFTEKETQNLTQREIQDSNSDIAKDNTSNENYAEKSEYEEDDPNINEEAE